MGVMPYRLEKGLFPTLVEHYFNDGLENVAPGAAAATALAAHGPSERLHAIWRYCSIAKKLRDAKANPQSIETVNYDNSIIESKFLTATSPTIAKFRATIAREWFGMQPTNGGWKRRLPSTWSQQSPTLGQWSGYYGNTELIVVEALQRMLEVSLGVPHLTTPPGTEAESEAQLRPHVTRVWPVYLFLTCPQPWFESWVTWQCHDKSSPVRGQVTVMLSTPGHSRPVAPSPVDVVADPTPPPPNPYFLSGGKGYVGTSVGPITSATAGPPYPHMGGDPKDTSVHDAAGQGMWVITHENHDSTIVFSTFKEPAPGNWNDQEAWDLPPIANYRCALLDQRKDLGGTPLPNALDGYYDIVVVAPAPLDGGVPVPP